MWDEYCDLSLEEKQICFGNLTEYIEELRREPKLNELFIEMTVNCNEHCVHCGSNCGDIKAKDTLTDKEILLMLVDLRNDLARERKPLPFLSITGGEPLVRPGILNLLMKIHGLGYRWGMTSNGILITAEAAKRLADAGMYSISISLDGTEQMHDRFRRTPGAYAKTLKAIDVLLEADIPSVMVTTVVHRDNYSELEEIYKTVKEHHVREWRLTNIEPIGRARENDELALTPEQYRGMLDFIAGKQKSDPDLRMLFTCNHYVGLKRERIVRPWFFFCRAGLEVAAVQYDGTIGPCLDIERRSDLSYGNVRKDRILDIWKKRFEVFREHKEEKSSKCSICEHKKNCMGGGFHTWDFDRNEPRICMLEMLGE